MEKSQEFVNKLPDLKLDYKLRMMEKSTSEEEIEHKNIGRLFLLKKTINKAILHSSWENGDSRFIISFNNLYLSSEFSVDLRRVIMDVFHEKYEKDNKDQEFRVGRITGLYLEKTPTFKLVPKKIERDYEGFKIIVVECFLTNKKK